MLNIRYGAHGAKAFVRGNRSLVEGPGPRPSAGYGPGVYDKLKTFQWVYGHNILSYTTNATLPGPNH